ncbi:MAG: hypothetical protein J07HN4v3_02806 [Halonotius sp. J07HN4]|nr:MAG: hypothetical protein J07HN4v3_02806 [Halonotius sp. J07HN4]
MMAVSQLYTIPIINIDFRVSIFITFLPVIFSYRLLMVVSLQTGTMFNTENRGTTQP